MARRHLQFHFRQLVRRISQPPQLRAQVLFVDRAIPRRAQAARRYSAVTLTAPTVHTVRSGSPS